MKDANPKTIYLEEYQQYEFDILETKLVFDIQDGETEVRSTLHVRRSRSAPPGADLRLDGRDLDLVEVALDGVVLGANQYRRDDESLTLFDVPDQAHVELVTRIRPEDNSALEGLYKSGGMYCTQCEAEGFRRITFYPDRPDVLSRFTTTIVADDARYPVLLSNGNPVADERSADGRRQVTWHDPHPKPSYLFALVAGDLALLEDSYVTRSGRAVTLRIYSEPHNIDQCDYAMDVLKRSMRWDEQVFGREYDLDVFMIVAVEDFNMGAMENKGLNIFNTSCVLASPDTASDAAYQRVEAVVAHEYFHNWSGNRVTCRDWFQLSLKEGFTVFRDAEFSSDMNSRAVKRIEDVVMLRSVQFAEDAGPLAHPVRPSSYIEISNFYTPTVYEKGAEVVRMLHTLLGAERFRAGSDLYFERHDGAAVTTEDFVRAMADASGVDLAQFQRWYDQAGTPVLEVSQSFADGVYSLHFSQRCPATPGQRDKAPFHVPVLFGLLDGDGRQLDGAALDIDASDPLEVRAGGTDEPAALLLHLRSASASVTVRGLAAAPTASVLRGFSAPVRVEFERPAAELAFLAEHDSDGFARWDALQTLIVAEIRALEDGAEPAAMLLDVFGALLQKALAASAAAPDDSVETRFMLAAMLTLPDENYLMQQSERIEVDALCDARARLRQALAERYPEQWQALYRANAPAGPYRPEAGAMARRSLQHAALGMYAAALDGADAGALLRDHYVQADNLSDRQAALGQLVRHQRIEDAVCAELLDDFHARWRDEALVVNVWLSLQASAARYDHEAIRALAAHPSFDARNPNKLRALYGAFSRQNHRRFHARDGSGYALLGEVVREVDARNPSMGAALAQPLTRWRRFDARRAGLMRAVLQELSGAATLSRDLYEVVSKSLADDQS